MGAQQAKLLPQAAAAAGERGLPRSDREFVDQMMYLLTAPVIVWPGWEDSFKDCMTDVTLHRMAHHREVFDQEMCTEYEAMLYVSSATLVAPPSHDWAEIYFWLFRRWNPKAADAAEIEAHDLNVNQKEDPARLRTWIFRRQREHLKRKAKGEEAPAKAGLQESKASPSRAQARRVQVIQERVF